jgi:hypothetical protein
MTDNMYVGWRKSSYSNSSANCVEVATGGGKVGVRDSKQDARGPVLETTAAGWSEFLHGIKTGNFDL